MLMQKREKRKQNLNGYINFNEEFSRIKKNLGVYVTLILSRDLSGFFSP